MSDNFIWNANSGNIVTSADGTGWKQQFEFIFPPQEGYQIRLLTVISNRSEMKMFNDQKRDATKIIRWFFEKQTDLCLEWISSRRLECRVRCNYTASREASMKVNWFDEKGGYHNLIAPAAISSDVTPELLGLMFESETPNKLSHNILANRNNTEMAFAWYVRDHFVHIVQPEVDESIMLDAIRLAATNHNPKALFGLAEIAAANNFPKNITEALSLASTLC